MIGHLPLSIIAARAHGVIGAKGRLPWHIPTDLRRFKALTWGKPLVMGRVTFDAIGRLLPGRDTIIVSRVLSAGEAAGATVAASLDDALAAAAAAAHRSGASEIMVAGGERIFRALLPEADRLYLTEVELVVIGDAYFPPFDASAWTQVSSVRPPRKPEDDAAVTFVDLRRARCDTPL